MANRLKSTKAETEAEHLVDDKEEVIEVKSLVRVERTHNIIGSALLFICFFLFVSFTSYLFTWTEDQDKIRDMGSKILRPNDLEINNLLGSFGAYVAFVFFEYGFGIASFLFCSFSVWRSDYASEQFVFWECLWSCCCHEFLTVAILFCQLATDFYD